MVFAIVGGSGFYEMDDLVVQSQQHIDTPFGSPSDVVTVGSLKHNTVLFLPRHGKGHVLPPHKVNYRANLYALKMAGATAVIAVHAVGGIAQGLKAGDIVVPDQIIDYSYGREHTYSDGSANPVVPEGVNHIDFTYPFTPSLRQNVCAAAQAIQQEVVEGGVYGCTQGPRLESAAEIRRMAQDGCTIVGMTAMPEAALAAELGLPYVSISMVANMAAGLGGGDAISLEDIHRVIGLTADRVKQLITQLIS